MARKIRKYGLPVLLMMLLMIGLLGGCVSGSDTVTDAAEAVQTTAAASDSTAGTQTAAAEAEAAESTETAVAEPDAAESTEADGTESIEMAAVTETVGPDTSENAGTTVTEQDSSEGTQTSLTEAETVRVDTETGAAAGVETSAETETAADPGAGAGTETAADPAGQLSESGVYTARDDVALYLHTYGHLPSNFITKNEARALGWEGGGLESIAPGKCIGGDYFGNYEGLLPEGSYRECDIDTLGAGSRGAKRLIYDDQGHIYYTADHYESFTQLY